MNFPVISRTNNADLPTPKISQLFHFRSTSGGADDSPGAPTMVILRVLSTHSCSNGQLVNELFELYLLRFVFLFRYWTLFLSEKELRGVSVYMVEHQWNKCSFLYLDNLIFNHLKWNLPKCISSWSEGFIWHDWRHLPSFQLIFFFFINSISFNWICLLRKILYISSKWGRSRKHGPVEDLSGLVLGIYIGRFLGNKCLISFSGIVMLKGRA